ncbi:FliH/SctL family protein [Oligoflexia bacterium]|nr:FliH/SctL family protein [Oligoflexia bacterium]
MIREAKTTENTPIITEHAVRPPKASQVIQAHYTGNEQYPGDLVYHAKMVAFEVMAQAKRDAQLTRSKATKAVNGAKKRARLTGYQNGERAAKQKAQTEALKAHNLYQDIIQKANNDCLALATQIATEVLGEVLPGASSALSTRLISAIGDLVDQNRITIVVHPSNKVQVLEDLKQQLQPANYNVIASEAIAPGNAKVETVSGSIELDWQDHLAAIRATLHSKLQVELQKGS